MTKYSPLSYIPSFLFLMYIIYYSPPTSYGIVSPPGLLFALLALGRKIWHVQCKSGAAFLHDFSLYYPDIDQFILTLVHG